MRYSEQKKVSILEGRHQNMCLNIRAIQVWIAAPTGSLLKGVKFLLQQPSFLHASSKV